jgi:hypothetical protein
VTAIDAAGGERSDAVYFQLDHGSSGRGGVVRLTGVGELEVVSEQSIEIAASPTGAVWFVYKGGVDVLTSEGRKTIELPEAFWPPSHILPAQGHLWVIAITKLGHWDGANWSEPISVGTEPYLRDLWVEEDGTLWVLGKDALYRRTSTGFEAVDAPELGLVPRLYPDAPRLTLKAEEGPFEYVDDKWKPLSFSGARNAMLARYRDDGTLVVLATDEAIVIPPHAPAQKHVLPPELEAHRLDWDFELGSDGRMWIATSQGIAVLDEQMKLQSWHEAGTIPLLRGGVLDVVVLGKGADSLPPAQPVLGRVRGKVLRNGRPFGDENVEMCANPIRGDIGDALSPCSEGTETEFTVEDWTLEDGALELWDVLPGTYYLAAELEEGWWVSPKPVCCEGMVEGKVYEMGKIEIR